MVAQFPDLVVTHGVGAAIGSGVGATGSGVGWTGSGVGTAGGRHTAPGDDLDEGMCGWRKAG